MLNIIRSPTAQSRAQTGFLQSALAEINADASQRLQTHQDKVDGKAHAARAGTSSAPGGAASSRGAAAVKKTPRTSGAAGGATVATPRTPRGPSAAGLPGQGQGLAAGAAPLSSGRGAVRPPVAGGAAKSGGGGCAKPGAGAIGGRPPSTTAAARSAVVTSPAVGAPEGAASPALAGPLQEKLAKLLQVKLSPAEPTNPCVSQRSTVVKDTDMSADRTTGVTCSVICQVQCMVASHTLSYYVMPLLCPHLCQEPAQHSCTSTPSL